MFSEKLTGCHHILHIIIIIIIIIILPPSLSPAAAAAVHPSEEGHVESALLRQLFTDYQNVARPGDDPASPVFVYIHFSLLQLNELSTRDQFISVNGWVTARWRDNRLTWDVNGTGVHSLTLPPSYVWLPEMTLANTAGHFFEEDHYRYFKVQIEGEDGMVYWYPGGEFKANCDIDVTFYPFDTQVCSFTFANWVFTSKQVNLSWDRVGEHDPLEAYEPDGEWEIIDTATVREELYECCPPSIIPELSFKMLLRRRSGFYVMNIVFPSIIVSGLVLLMFWLPPEAGEKVSMSLTLLLSFTIFILLVSDNVPNSSLAVPLIEIYLFSLLALTGLSVCTSVLVLYMHHHLPDVSPAPWLKCLLRIKTKRYDVKQDASSETRASGRGVRGFLVNNLSQRDLQVGTLSERAEDQLEAIHGLLEKLVNDQTASADNDKALEWRKVAVTIDRICFWCFLTIFGIVTLLFLAIIPRYVPHSFSEIEARQS